MPDFVPLKLTKAASRRKLWNAWWSTRTVEVEKHTWSAQQSGHGGLLTRELFLLKKNCLPSLSTLIVHPDLRQ